MKKINMFLRNQPPGRMIVAGFAAVILLGMLVLLLPISVKDGAEVTVYLYKCSVRDRADRD